MACATLKRSLDFDPLHSPKHGSPKRRRCLPMNIAPSTPPPTQKDQSRSAFSDATPKLTSGEIAAKISNEIKRMQRRRLLCPYPSPSSSPPPPSSQQHACAPGNSPYVEPQVSPDGGSSADHAVHTFNALSPSSKKDGPPLFTFRQVALICDRMLRDREDQLKCEYDRVLTCKLAEQYEAFLKFNHDQIQRRFVEAPVSYVS